MGNTWAWRLLLSKELSTNQPTNQPTRRGTDVMDIYTRRLFVRNFFKGKCRNRHYRSPYESANSYGRYLPKVSDGRGIRGYSFIVHVKA
jgi:hypothetical protein